MRIGILVGAAAMAIAAGTAGATTIQARLDSIGPSRDMGVSSNGGVSSQTLRSGVNNFTVLGGDPTELAPTFRAFCIDLAQTINIGGTFTYEVRAIEASPVPGGPMGAAKADLLRELWGRHYAHVDTQNEAAGFQLAVWEIVFDSGLDLTGGTVRATGEAGALATAASYLGSLTGNSVFFAPVYALSSPGTQDMLVPAPGALALVGLAGLVAGRRRR
jgi:MYXO-CTERM domain-containing protein